MTEAIVARAQGNYASVDDIAADVKEKLGGETVGVIFPILSRNRFAVCLRGIAKGAKKIYACATHGLFSGPAYERLENSCIEEVVVTNAVPVPLERQTGKIKVVTLAPLFAQTIKNVYNNGSVASLFE